METNNNEYVIEMLNITKEFPGIKANDNITVRLKKGSIHALLGENGAGKSTLMSVLFGLYKPDGGVIKVRGKEVNIANPNVATDFGIGMVHQHFKLVENFTVTENIILGIEPKKAMGLIDINKAEKKVREISEKYNLQVDPSAKIEDISVGMQQRVEILKMLYRDAEILIFDEPTAVLTPQEISSLMDIMKLLVKQGKSIILITHKLKEIKEVADECTVIRKGKGIGTVVVKDTTTQEMADLMVGRNVIFEVSKAKAEPKEVVLEVKNLTYKKNKDIFGLNNVSFDIKAGEIVGIAGIEGNGQTELINCVTGLAKQESGEVKLSGKTISNETIRNRTNEGIGHIPEDRHKYGLVLDYTLEDNFILQTYFKEDFSEKGILKREAIAKQSNELIKRFDVRSGKGSKTVVRSMSGGNQQKAIIGREIVREPSLLIAAQPTRGLDVGAIEFVHKELIAARDKGAAVMLVSLELDEILCVSDRILVMYDGKIVGELNTEETDEKEIGLLMAGSRKGEDGEK